MVQAQFDWEQWRLERVDGKKTIKVGAVAVVHAQAVVLAGTPFRPRKGLSLGHGRGGSGNKQRRAPYRVGRLTPQPPALPRPPSRPQMSAWCKRQWKKFGFSADPKCQKC